MRIAFHDNIGTQETIYFSPEIVFYSDGTVVVLPGDAYANGVLYKMPIYAGKSKELWVDIGNSAYHQDPSLLKPGAFRFLWVEGGKLCVARYKEQIAKEPLLTRLKRYAGIA